ncbi:MAG: helix-turn-helix domain-containing protein [Clostridium fessum]
MTLKDRVKNLAQERGISLPALESELGFGNSTIVKWDKSTPNADKLNAVAKYFNVTMDYLLNGETKDSLTLRDERDIEKILDQTREQLLSREGLMFDG